MRERLIRFAGRLYPASWRGRYGVEFDALLEDAGRSWRDVSDVLLGALKMQLTTWTFGKTAAFGVVCAVLCYAVSFVAVPDKYTSVCTLRLTPSLLWGDPQPAADNAEEFVKSLIQDALAGKALADIINTLGLYPSERARNPMEDVIETMRHDVRFDRIGRSDAFHVSFHYRDAELARRTERELVGKLMEGNIALRRAGRFAFNLEVLDPANLPKLPSSPNRFLIAAMGLAGGLLLGLLAALVARARAATDPAGNSPKSS